MPLTFAQYAVLHLRWLISLNHPQYYWENANSRMKRRDRSLGRSSLRGQSTGNFESSGECARRSESSPTRIGGGTVAEEKEVNRK